MKGMRSLAGPLLSAVLVAPAAAGPIYITDSVTVALFPDPSLTGEPIQRLLSATPVELLSNNDGIAQIRTEAGQTGWVRSTFLTASVPAVIQLDETLKLVDELQDELAAAKAELAQAQKEAAAAKDVRWLKAELKKTRAATKQAEQALAQKQEALAALQQTVTESDQRLAELTAANEDLQQRLAAAELIASDGVDNEAEARAETGNGWLAWWPLPALIAAAAIGFAAGYRWLDHKVRGKRLAGGIRIYYE